MTGIFSLGLFRNKRPLAKRRKLFTRTEALESRALLSADFSAGLSATNMLSVDPDAYDPSSILVRYRTEIDGGGSGSSEFFGPNGITVIDTGIDFAILPGMHEYSLPEGLSVVEALDAFRDDPNVLYAEPNYIVRIATTPNDSQFDSLWAMNNIGQTGGTFDADIDAVEAWDITTGNGSTIVAIIDTGVDYTHQDLAANIWVNPGEIAGDGIDNDGNGYVDDIHGYDFANNDPDPMDDNNHGTHVAGTIGGVANNGKGVAGVNWNVTIMPLKFLAANGSGSLGDAIAALDYAVANGAKISNNSWGFNGAFSQFLFDAVQNAQNAGHIFVAAAGNGDGFGNGLNNDSTAFYPSNFELDNIVAVAATDHNDHKAGFSNYGATTVDVGAPGVAILSTTIGNSYSTFSGTSMATPHTTGLLSLIMDQNPGWDYRQVIDRLYETVDPLAALDGITVTGGRINAAAALGPDITGPRVVSSNPSDFLFDPFSSVRVAFSEAIDPTSFRNTDISSFSGPNGSINVSGVSVVSGSNNRQFDINFSTQSDLGTYTIVLGPDVADLAGNLMDQDRDGISGEPIDDEHTIEFSLVPFFANFDFGTATSPVAAAYKQVLMTTGYTAEEGFGWSSGIINSRDRGASLGDDLTRDFNLTELGTFLVDVPDEAAIYQVTLTMGDGLAGRDEMGVFLEGILFDSVTSATGVYETNTYQVTVSDAQLTITLDDLGGSDPLVMINSIEINALGPDLFGPKVISANPVGDVTGSLDRITLAFDEAIDPQSFTTDDVISLSGPGGVITPTSINMLSDTTFEVVFDSQTQFGDYSLSVGPGIADVAGNLMNQDGDASNGEDPDDRFTTTVTLITVPPFEQHFDFGTTSSPVAAGYTRISHGTNYTSTLGFGWLSGTVGSRDRGATYGNELERDFNLTELATFVIDVPESTVYEITITMGDGLSLRDEMGVFLEEILVDSVTSPSGEYVTNTYQVTVSDGQLTLLLDDLGGSNTLVMINALDVLALNPDTAGPQVLATNPSGEVIESMDRIEVSFNEGMDGSTFTLADVVRFTGPSGAISPTAVNQLSPANFEVLFPTQSELGAYTLTIGPDITDVTGNPMNQDGDGINGETIEDRFSTTLNLVPIPPFERHFDFGTISSPVAGGYTRVAEITGYSSAQGFGWLSGVVNSRDRGSLTGTDLERDFNLTELATFVVDVHPEPTLYDVTLTMGDALSERDLMGVIIEGSLVDSVTSPSGQYVTNTYRVSVADGQLTLLLDDLGGNNTLVMINGLEIVEVGPDNSGPRVLSSDPVSEISGSLDRFTVTFDEAIDEQTFTTADIVNFTGPGGAISPLVVNRLAANTFEITFNSQTELGEYALTLGPEIADVAGNLMNQDGDATNGEAIDDQFTSSVTIVPIPPFELHFDFGTASSPVAAGYTRVASNTVY